MTKKEKALQKLFKALLLEWDTYDNFMSNCELWDAVFNKRSKKC